MFLQMVIKLLPTKHALAHFLLVLVRRNGMLGYRVAMPVLHRLWRFDIGVFRAVDLVGERMCRRGR